LLGIRERERKRERETERREREREGGCFISLCCQLTKLYSVGGTGMNFEKRALVNDNDKRIFPSVTLSTTNLKCTGLGPLPSSANVKNVWNYASIPQSVFTACTELGSIQKYLCYKMCFATKIKNSYPSKGSQARKIL
jgi:hypothetical protein